MKPSDSSLQSSNHDQPARVASGWIGLGMTVALYAAVPLLIFIGARTHVPLLMFGGVLALIVAVGLSCGFFTLQPNEGMVLILFGAYKGTVRDSGFFVVNPFSKRIKISLRTRNFNSDKIKVNEKRGNPIEIAAVVVWRVQDTAQACFDVDNYENYVRVQMSPPCAMSRAAMPMTMVSRTRSRCAGAVTTYRRR